MEPSDMHPELMEPCGRPDPRGTAKKSSEKVDVGMRDIPAKHFSFSENLSLSVTRLGDLLHFGRLFKACGNNYFAKIAHIFRRFL